MVIKVLHSVNGEKLTKLVHGIINCCMPIKNSEDKVLLLNLLKVVVASQTEERNRGADFAAQNQALQTNAMQAKVEKILNDAKCGVCKEKDETIDHSASGCSKTAQSDYKKMP